MHGKRRIHHILAGLMPGGQNGREGKLSQPKAGRPFMRSTDSGLQLLLEELKFLRSVDDLKAFYHKVAYFLPRLSGFWEQSVQVPPGLEIEPTNYCNLRCICCPASKSSRQKGFMDVALFHKIIDEASQIGVQRVWLYLLGEPLLHPRIVEMVRYVKSRDLGLHLTTNGLLLTRDKAEGILRSGVDSADYVTFSVLGSSREVYETVMRQGNYDLAVHNIREFVALRRALGVNGPVVSTTFFIMPENEHELAPYLRSWRGVVDHARAGGRISEAFSERPGAGTAIAPRQYTCNLIWEKMTVLWNGDVTICGMDVNGERVLGNLNEQSIRETWNSEPLLAVRRIHRERRFKDFPFCLNWDM